MSDYSTDGRDRTAPCKPKVILALILAWTMITGSGQSASSKTTDLPARGVAIVSMAPAVRDPAVQDPGTHSDSAPAQAGGIPRHLALLTSPDGMMITVISP